MLPRGDTRCRMVEAAIRANEILTAVPAGQLEPDYMARCRENDLRAIEAGATMRTIYTERICEHQPSKAFITDTMRWGADVRLTRTLPTWLMIIDRRLVFIPSDAHDLDRGSIVIDGGGPTAFLTWMFQQTWRSGRRLEMVTAAQDVVRTDLDRMVLAMMINGVKDEVGAKRLSISVRTYRRHISEICLRLGASSRFQAGVRAAEAGVLRSVLSASWP
ncbi:MAG: hypothetical protein WCB04_00240 [Mycobacteriales bacterium]